MFGISSHWDNLGPQLMIVFIIIIKNNEYASFYYYYYVVLMIVEFGNERSVTVAILGKHRCK